MSLIETVDLVYVYGQNTPFMMTALDNVNLKIEKGGIKAVIGHTGSGKSTLIQHFNALLKPYKGKVTVNGVDINESKEQSYKVRFKVGLCFQYPEYQLFESTVYKDIAFGPQNMGLSADEVDLAVRTAAGYVGVTPDMFDKSPFDLSGGQKRRVAIAGVMAMNPELLILDEPIAGLDPAGREQVLAMIKNYCRQTEKTVMIVSHSMDDVAEIADEVIVVNKGNIAMHGSVDEIFSKSSELCSMGLNIPEVAVIADGLRQRGIKIQEGLYTVDEAARALADYAYGRKS